MFAIFLIGSLAAAGVSPTPTPTCWFSPIYPDTTRLIECSETRVVEESPRPGLSPLRMFILEPKGGTGMRHVWDDVVGYATAYPVKNHTPVSLLTPAHGISYGEWIATVTAEAPRSKKRNPTPGPTMTEYELHFALGLQAYDEGRYDNAQVLLEHVADKGPKFAVAKDLLELIKQQGEKQGQVEAPWICYHKWVTSPMQAVAMVDDDPGMSKRYGFMSQMRAHGLCLREKDGDDYARGSVGNFYGVGWVHAMVVPLEHCLKCGVLRVRPSDRKTVGLTEDQRDAILRPTEVARQREKCRDLAGRPLPNCTPTKK